MNKLLILSAALALIVALPAAAEEANPYQLSDETWISLSGEVETVSANAFVLDYGNGMITVEMDDGDRDADGYKLLPGDEVTVTGVIDDGFFESTTIEAGSVYVAKLGTYFYASSADEESDYPNMYTPGNYANTVVQGTVTSVSDDEFKLDTGMREITVSVEDMAYDPLDDEGYQKVEVGDMVAVGGDLEYEFFQGRQLDADYVTTLVKHFNAAASSR